MIGECHGIGRRKIEHAVDLNRIGKKVKWRIEVGRERE